MFLEGLVEEEEEEEEEGGTGAQAEEAKGGVEGVGGRGGVGLRLRAPNSMLVMLPVGEERGGGRGARKSVSDEDGVSCADLCVCVCICASEGLLPANSLTWICLSV